jgi:hypothetical protein
LISKVGRLFNELIVKSAVEPWLDIEVTPVVSAKFRVVAPVDVITNFSISFELTDVVVAENLAVIVSTPPPPSRVSPLFKVRAVEASKVCLTLHQ